MNLIVPVDIEKRGYVARSELLQLGYTDEFIRHRLKRGDWVRVRNGAYAPTEMWERLSLEQRHLVTARAAQDHSSQVQSFSHVTAALALGAAVWDIPLDEVHLTRAGGTAGRAEAGSRHHRGLILPEDLVQVDGRWVTSPARAALETCTMADLEHALVVMDSMLHKKLVTLEELWAQYERMTAWPNILHARLALGLADAGGESPGETRTRFLCWRNSLPAPTTQIPIAEPGREPFARVDMGWPEHDFLLEFDGVIKYHRFRREGETIEQMVIREKQREDRIRDVTGCRVIRVVWSDLYRPKKLAARIAQRLAQGSRRSA